jgi:hypothetical protein
MYPGTQSVKRKFSNWDAHSSHAEIAQSENALTISDYNDFNSFRWRVAEQRRNLFTVRI